MLVALTSTDAPSQVTQIYVPLDKIDSSENNMWLSAFDYALKNVSNSETEVFEVQTTSTTTYASSTYVANAVKQRLSTANGTECNQMLVFNSYKYSGYTLFARLTRMNEAERIQLTTFKAGMTGASIAASLPHLLGSLFQLLCLRFSLSMNWHLLL